MARAWILALLSVFVASTILGDAVDLGRHELSGPVSLLWSARHDGPASGYDYGTLVGLSPDGSVVFFSGSETTATSGASRYLTRAHDAATGREIWSARYDQAFLETPYVLVVSADGRTVFVTGQSGSDSATVAYSAETGDLLWAARYSEHMGDDWGYAMALSPDGATVFVAGASESVATGHDIAAMAYDAATGTSLWVARYDGPGRISYWDDWASQIVVAPDGRTVFVTGYSAGVGTDLDIVTLAYDAATGHQIWVSRRNGSADYEDTGSGIAVSPDGDTVFVTGHQTQLGTGFDCVVLAYEATTGEEVWATLYDGPASSTDHGTAIRISADGGTVYVNGTSRGAGASSNFDVLTLALDAATGAEVWTARYAGPYGGYDFGENVVLSPDGTTVYVAGGSDGAPGNRDAVAVAYDAATGQEIWSARYDGPAQGSDGFRRIAVSPSGSVLYAIGHSSGVGTSRDWLTLAYTTRTTLEVGIDIKPGDEPNRVNARNRGVVPVALLGSASFAVADIEVTTLRFGPAGAEPAHDLSDPDTWSQHLQDVNFDGFMDLILHFRTGVTGIGCDDESATLTGTTLAGQSFEGRDTIAAAGCVGFPTVFEVEPRSARAGSVVGIQPR